MYDAYSFAVIPRIGGLVAGDADSYQYLVESIRQFPDQVGNEAGNEDRYDWLWSHGLQAGSRLVLG